MWALINGKLPFLIPMDHPESLVAERRDDSDRRPLIHCRSDRVQPDEHGSLVDNEHQVAEKRDIQQFLDLNAPEEQDVSSRHQDDDAQSGQCHLERNELSGVGMDQLRHEPIDFSCAPIQQMHGQKRICRAQQQDGDDREEQRGIMPVGDVAVAIFAAPGEPAPRRYVSEDKRRHRSLAPVCIAGPAFCVSCCHGLMWRVGVGHLGFPWRSEVESGSCFDQWDANDALRNRKTQMQRA